MTSQVLEIDQDMVNAFRRCREASARLKRANEELAEAERENRLSQEAFDALEARYYGKALVRD